MEEYYYIVQYEFFKIQTIMLLGLGMVLKIVGLWLIFKKGFWEQK